MVCGWIIFTCSRQSHWFSQAKKYTKSLVIPEFGAKLKEGSKPSKVSFKSISYKFCNVTNTTPCTFQLMPSVIYQSYYVSNCRHSRKLTSIMWPVEMSMFEWAGSSLQDEMLLRAEGLTAGPPSLNWDDTLLILEEIGSGRSVGGLTAIRCRQSSYGRKSRDRSVGAVMQLWQLHLKHLNIIGTTS